MKFSLIEKLDDLAMRWLNRRIERKAKDDPVLADELKLMHLEADRGRVEIFAEHPQVVAIAEGMAQFLDHAGATNYFEFDFIPRLTSNLRKIRMTVQFADGLSPAQRADELYQELETARSQITELQDYIAKIGG